MKNSKTSSTKPSSLNLLVALAIIFSFIGFIDSSYLTIKFFTGGTLPCSFLKGCDFVTTSSFAKILGIPVALLGAIYYLLVFFLALAYRDTKKKVLVTLLGAIPFLGFLATLWFLYVQIFILKALCLYCLISAGTSTVLAVLAILILRQKESHQNNNLTPPLKRISG